MLTATVIGTNEGAQEILVTRNMRVVSLPHTIPDGGKVITLSAPGRFTFRSLIPYHSPGPATTVWFRATVRVYAGGSLQLSGHRWWKLRRKVTITW